MRAWPCRCPTLPDHRVHLEYRDISLSVVPGAPNIVKHHAAQTTDRQSSFPAAPFEPNIKKHRFRAARPDIGRYRLGLVPFNQLVGRYRLRRAPCGAARKVARGRAVSRSAARSRNAVRPRAGARGALQDRNALQPASCRTATIKSFDHPSSTSFFNRVITPPSGAITRPAPSRGVPPGLIR